MKARNKDFVRRFARLTKPQSSVTTTMLALTRNVIATSPSLFEISFYYISEYKKLNHSMHLIYLLFLLTWKCDALSSISVSPKTTSPISSISGFDYATNSKLPWSPNGYQTWNWKNNSINYIEMGDPAKPPLLLIHGFGASVYHFRYNIPILARDYHVFAFDMLGFGLSSKPLQEYPAEVWRDQTIDFICNVIGKPTTVAGNSLGGFTALYAAASCEANVIPACILLNAAGTFRQDSVSISDDKVSPSSPNWIQSLQSVFERFVLAVSFWYTQQPARIEQVLKQVYPIVSNQVDDELIESIQLPSRDPNAPEVFYQIVSKSVRRTTYIDDLLPRLNGRPLLLCWGEFDPWIRPTAADKIQDLYGNQNYCKRISIEAGHCPHDEAPESVNRAIQDFLTELNF
jgi:pimeloyl-ACP methyl ester carboxylesterase